MELDFSGSQEELIVEVDIVEPDFQARMVVDVEDSIHYAPI